MPALIRAAFALISAAWGPISSKLWAVLTSALPWVAMWFLDRGAKTVIAGVAIGGFAYVAWEHVGPHLAAGKAAWMLHVHPRLEIANAWIPVTEAAAMFAAYGFFLMTVVAGRWAMGVYAKS